MKKEVLTRRHGRRMVSPNYLMMGLRIILFIVVCYFYALFLLRIAKRDFDDDTGAAMFGFLFFSFIVVYLGLSILGIFRVKYDEDTGNIELHRLFNIHRFNVSDIEGYYISTLQSKWKNYSGYYLMLKNGNVFEINEYNAKPLKNFYSFIVRSGVPCKGMKKSWYPFRRRIRY